MPPAVTPPACPTPVEEIAEAIDRIGPLHGLPFEDRLWLARHGEEVVAEAGSILFEEGASADRMILILKGEIHVRRQLGGPMALFIGRTGQMTGLLPFSRMKSYGGQGFAVTPVWAILIHKSLFPEMLEAIPSMAQRVVSTLLDRVREVTRIEQQAEKLTALGKLAGNLCSRAEQSSLGRTARGLQPGHGASRQPPKPIQAGEPVPERGANSGHRRLGATHPQPPPRHGTPDAGELIAREESLRNWLSELPCEGAWEVAAQLAEQAVNVADLDALRAILEPREICVALQYFARYLRVYPVGGDAAEFN